MNGVSGLTPVHISHGAIAPTVSGHPHYRGFTVASDTQHSEDYCGLVIRSSQRPLPDNTQHSQQTDIHAPAGFEPTIPASERP